ncbi:MAG: PAS domain-containing protein, partial [Bacteroidetes bacterium]|nr:PAS domain-containing protein [Bacteroidota bacterium]
FYELIGYKNNEIEANKKTFISLLHPDDVDHVKEHVRAALKNNGYYDIEYRLKLKSGKSNWFQACANVEKDNKGNPIRMTGSLQDINDKKIIEDKDLSNWISFGFSAVEKPKGEGEIEKQKEITNDKAIISGNILEDEKVLGTCHIALGNNTGFGGKINIPLHLDGIIKNPTISVDNKKIMESGKLLI